MCLFQDDEGEFSFDLGAQWVGRSQKNIWALLEELNIGTYPQYVTGRKLMQVRGILTRSIRS